MPITTPLQPFLILTFVAGLTAVLLLPVLAGQLFRGRFRDAGRTLIAASVMVAIGIAAAVSLGAAGVTTSP
jgi:hypothetical protein